MRLIVQLRATVNAAYNSAYHHKLRGALWTRIGDQYSHLHDAPNPIPMTFTNVMPWGEINEGGVYTVVIASPLEELLRDLSESLHANQELNVGEMRFRVVDQTVGSEVVGEPGDNGYLETQTGVMCALPKPVAETYGLDASKIDMGEAETRLYWQPEHGIGPFREVVEHALQHHHDVVYGDRYPGPCEVEGPLFDSYELLKTFSIPVTLTTGVTHPYVLSKWRLGYTVRCDNGVDASHHRRHLNLALDCGVGQKTSHGFGFLDDATLVDRVVDRQSQLHADSQAHEDRLTVEDS